MSSLKMLNVVIHPIEFYNLPLQFAQGQLPFSKPQEWPILIESCYKHLNFHTLIKSGF